MVGLQKTHLRVPQRYCALFRVSDESPLRRGRGADAIAHVLTPHVMVVVADATQEVSVRAENMKHITAMTSIKHLVL